MLQVAFSPFAACFFFGIYGQFTLFMDIYVQLWIFMYIYEYQ